MRIPNRVVQSRDQFRMSNRAASYLVILILVGMAGCASRVMESTMTITTTGDTVTNKNGNGIGTVAGVEIKVQGLKSNDAGAKHTVKSADGSNGSTMSERWDVDFGEVKLVFQRENNGPVSLNIDGQDYGLVKDGDRLLIDENRTTFVNDQQREAN